MSFLFRPTEEIEAQMLLPGDDIVRRPLLEITRAITINAPAERILRWLSQMGQGRAGFYSDSPWWDAAVDFYYRVLSREQGGTRGFGIRSATQPSCRSGRICVSVTPSSMDHRALPITSSSERANRSLLFFTDTHLPYLLPSRLRDRVSAELTDALILIRLTDSQTRVVQAGADGVSPACVLAGRCSNRVDLGQDTAHNFFRRVKMTG